MFGKFLKCLVPALISLFIGQSLLFGYDDIKVNGYTIAEINSESLLGLRNKATGDRYLNMENYYQAIKFFEEAAVYLPTEADIYFNLGNCYYYLALDSSENSESRSGIFSMAIDYYSRAIEIYEYPENAGKSMRNYYLSLIRHCYSLPEVDGDNTQANEIKYDVIIPIEDDIYDNYPELADELEELYELLHVGLILDYEYEEAE